MSATYIKEACVESLEQALNAEKLGADRLELCADLDLDGLTPATKLIKEVIAQVQIPVRVIIRPRAGDFVYSKAELDAMKTSIQLCKELGVAGVVFGVLKSDNSLDLVANGKLARAAKPMKTVIHKAIDYTPDPLEALKQVIHLKSIDTVLTSGGLATAFDGIETLKAMIELAGDELELMPAGRITNLNVEELHSILNANAYHGSRIVGELR